MFYFLKKNRRRRRRNFIKKIITMSSSYFQRIVGEKPSIPEIIPIETERIYTELGRRVNRDVVSADGSALKSKALVFKKVLETSVKCLRCKQSFLPKINFLYRDCKMHYGSLEMNNFKRVYSCCRRTEYSPGCVSAMHVSRQEMFELVSKDPYNSFVEIPKILVDSGEIRVSTEIITDYPKSFVSKKRLEEIKNERNSNDKIRNEDWVYRINMVVIF